MTSWPRQKDQVHKEVPLTTVTWHDPCHMGRLGRVPMFRAKIWTASIVQPRTILKSIPGVELAEMERIKEVAWCCGRRRGLHRFQGFAQWTARERLTEAKDTGARAV